MRSIAMKHLSALTRPSDTSDKPIWCGRRFELRKFPGEPTLSLSWDFEFVDRFEGGTVAYVRQVSEAGYEIHLAIPNTDPFTVGSVPEICSEVPKLIRSYMRSRRPI